MTDQEAYIAKFNAFVKEYPYLITESSQYIPFSDYLDYFIAKNKSTFNYLIPPNIYNPPILNELKDRLVYTTFGSASNGGKQMFSIFQIDTDTHLSASYLWIKKADSLLVGFDIYCRDGRYFLDFLDKYKDLEYKEKEEPKPFGFAAKLPELKT